MWKLKLADLNFEECWPSYPMLCVVMSSAWHSHYRVGVNVSMRYHMESEHLIESAVQGISLLQFAICLSVTLTSVCLSLYPWTPPTVWTNRAVTLCGLSHPMKVLKNKFSSWNGGSSSFRIFVTVSHIV